MLLCCERGVLKVCHSDYSCSETKSKVNVGHYLLGYRVEDFGLRIQLVVLIIPPEADSVLQHSAPSS